MIDLPEQTISLHIYNACFMITNIEERDKIREYIKVAEQYELSRHSTIKPNDYRLFKTIQQSEEGV